MLLESDEQISEIAVSGREVLMLADPHPRIRKTAEALRRAEAGKRGLLCVSGNGIVEVSVSRESVTRTVTLLSQMFHAADNRGWSFVKNSNPLQLIVDDEGIGLTVSENTARKEGPRAEGDEQYYETFGPYWDYTPTGKLTVAIAGSDARGLRTHWTDGTCRPVESQVEKTLSEVVRHAAAKKEERHVKERRHVIAMRDLQRRRDEATRHAEEERRVGFLSEHAANFAEAERYSSFLHSLQRSIPPSSRTAALANFLGWGWAYVDSRRALCEVEAIEVALAGSDYIGLDAADAASRRTRG
jgi:hypothetical protein